MKKTYLALLTLLIVILTALISCSSCATLPSNSERADRKDLVISEYRSTVSIQTICYDGSMHGGSGVIISKRLVLTAEHVVACDGLYWATTKDGFMHILEKDLISPGTDIIRLRSMGDDFDSAYVRHITITKAEPGDTVCVSPNYPRVNRRCGEVQYNPGIAGDKANNIDFDIVVEPGNSGSPLFDSNGNLVAIVTELTFCNNGQYCGGRGTKLWGRSYLLSEN